MPVQIDTSNEGGDVTVRVSGLGSQIGMISILLHAKFARPISVDRLLSPFLNDIISALDAELRRKEFDVPTRASESLQSYDVEEMRMVVRDYARSKGLSAEVEEDTLRQAFYPAAVPRFAAPAT